ncbi:MULTISPECIES: AraC family transcriptional regulator [Cohnella]|jgi:AraC-like DNA-binding protein/mannose-6-phosphate isomerase-like protein (cupin superfamily)|uniref:AraC family transcriptional regulator n=1 Tax=Cohnella TaxID=329857 RepID=UPI0003630715|nr:MULTISPECIES: AraC family transcriptional regulator [Cohnella]REK67844.1 MAG: AraC family transcriptional regulator [Cohnella sp.]
MPHPQPPADTLVQAVNEQVVYQNPLLFLKVWEICDGSDRSGTPEAWPWHYHKEAEFLAISEGRLRVQTPLASRTLGPGDVMVIGSSGLHRTAKASEEPLRYVVFQVELTRHFDPGMLPYLNSFSELIVPLEQVNYIFEEQPSAKREAHALVTDIYRESAEKKIGYEMAISSSVKRLLLLLLRHDTRRLLRRADDAGLARFRPVLDYVDRHLSEKISVDDVRVLLGMSYHHFIKSFKKVMGVPFVDYVNYNRIKKAERLLATTDLSILEIGFEVGIWNMAQFYKLFRRYNPHSPKEFRQRMRG